MSSDGGDAVAGKGGKKNKKSEKQEKTYIRKVCYNVAGRRNQQKKANTKLDEQVTQRDREVKHGCKSSTNSETGRSKKKFGDCQHTDLRDCICVRRGIRKVGTYVRQVVCTTVYIGTFEQADYYPDHNRLGAPSGYISAPSVNACAILRLQ